MKNKVRKVRKDLKLTQTKLSVISGVSRTTINAIENGKIKNIESETMFKIATALNVDIGDIFFIEAVVFKQQSD